MNDLSANCLPASRHCVGFSSDARPFSAAFSGGRVIRAFVLGAILWLAGQSHSMAVSPEKIARRKPVSALNVHMGRAVKGYDVVSYFADGKAQKGSADFSVQWRGATWQFASADHRAAFLRGPGRFAPEYGGYCAFAISQGNVVDVDPRQWKIVNGRLYLNANIFAQTLWRLDPAGRIKKGDSNWRLIPRRNL